MDNDTKLILKFVYKMMAASYVLMTNLFSRCNQLMEERNRIERNRCKRGVYLHSGGSSVSECFAEKNNINRIVLGKLQYKNDIIYDYIIKQHRYEDVTIVLHTGDSSLANILRNSIGKDVVLINDDKTKYDFFCGVAHNDVVKLIIDTGKKEYKFDDNIEHYIRGMLLLFEKIGKKASLYMFLDWPYDNAYEQLEHLVSMNKIREDDARNINTLLRMGESERYKLRRYFENLSNQTGYDCEIWKERNRITNLENVVSGICVINVFTPSDDLFLNLLFKQIQCILYKNRKINLVCSNLMINRHSAFYEYINHNGKNINCNLLIISEDLYNDCGAHDETFNELLGICSDKMIFSHNVGVGADKLANAIGYYEVEEKSLSTTIGTSQRMFDIFPMRQQSQTETVSLKRKHIIPPEELWSMKFNEVYLYKSIQNQLIHTYLKY